MVFDGPILCLIPVDNAEMDVYFLEVVNLIVYPTEHFQLCCLKLSHCVH